MPSLNSIDHVHVYVASWSEAEPWYRDVLGFTRMAEFESWAVDGGPLTLESDNGRIHLALFESDASPSSAIAFGASGDEFLAWKSHLEGLSIELRVADHSLAWSMYFHDPFGNYHEITSYDHSLIANSLN